MSLFHIPSVLQELSEYCDLACLMTFRTCQKIAVHPIQIGDVTNELWFTLISRLHHVDQMQRHHAIKVLRKIGRAVQSMKDFEVLRRICRDLQGKKGCDSIGSHISTKQKFGNGGFARCVPRVVPCISRVDLNWFADAIPIIVSVCPDREELDSSETLRPFEFLSTALYSIAALTQRGNTAAIVFASGWVDYGADEDDSSEDDVCDSELRCVRSIRQGAIYSLQAAANIGDGSAISTLLGRLEDGDEFVRSAAVTALDSIAVRGDEAVVMGLCNLCENDQQCHVRSMALRTLLRIAREGHWAAISSSLHCAVEFDQPFAGECLDGVGQLAIRGDERVINALLACVDEECLEIRPHDVFSVLAEVAIKGNRSVIAALCTYINRKNDSELTDNVGTLFDILLEVAEPGDVVAISALAKFMVQARFPAAGFLDFVRNGAAHAIYALTRGVEESLWMPIVKTEFVFHNFLLDVLKDEFRKCENGSAFGACSASVSNYHLGHKLAPGAK